MNRNGKSRATTRDNRNAAVSMLLLGTCAAIVVISGNGCQPASTTDPDPPSGGQKYVLDYSVFASQIDPILSTQGCDNLNCHGGGIRGTFQLSPSNDKDTAFDFAQASMQVNPVNPTASSLVTKPLDEACGGVGHGGGAFFHSLDDPDYLAILAWIEAGEYQ